jgi:antitoxin component YwqK of YwqJK toxin-antitoxin module
MCPVQNVTYLSGQLRAKGSYKAGERDGPWVDYHDNGQLKEKGTYKAGGREGLFFLYEQDGRANEVATGTYKNGEKLR